MTAFPHTAPRRWSRRRLLAALPALGLAGCARGPQMVRLTARPTPPTARAAPGEHPLGLGSWWRDGTLYVPRQADLGRPLPLIVLLHGGGGSADDFREKFPMADAFGVVMLALDARDNTWDGVDSPFGPDVRFIDDALRATFDRVAVDPARLALGGLSDGGFYALSLGIVNGDLFTHLAAVAPGWMAPPAPAVGHPRIFIGHGTRDTVYGVRTSRVRVVPELRRRGYDVTYYEFVGPHWIVPDAARALLRWFLA
ncbi:MAG: alpha/beta hydrolase [Vicinamibacterales bacterium]